MTETHRWLTRALRRAILGDLARALWQAFVGMHTRCPRCQGELDRTGWFGYCPRCQRHVVLPDG